MVVQAETWETFRTHEVDDLLGSVALRGGLENLDSVISGFSA